jgi:CheY-like chemotaxis protein/anti-sigma regulatory factor (Ser/Thr protein kinase)
MLDFAKIEAGKLEVESLDTHPRALLEELHELLQPQFSVKQLRASWSVADRVPDCVRTDPLRLRQILMNLLSNAVKFTESGQVTVSVDIDESAAPSAPEAPITLRCEVTDTGVGIEPALRERLFSAFTQADSSTTRKYGGTGLGLSITKQLVELMHGQIGVSSTPGVGSTFWFTLPVQRAADRAVADSLSDGRRGQAIVPAADPDPDLIPGLMRVLLVEDNPVNQLVARGALNSFGMSVETVSNGQQALDALAQKPYDVVLMDCHMPIMDGYEATARIREFESQGSAQGVTRVPIIGLTANTMTGDRERCLDAGMDDYLPKPYSRPELRAIVMRWLRSSSDPKVADQARAGEAESGSSAA